MPCRGPAPAARLVFRNPNQHHGRYGVTWGLANSQLGEREVTHALLEREYRLIHAGQVILGDKGFAGRDFERFVTEDLRATLIRPDRKDEEPRFG